MGKIIKIIIILAVLVAGFMLMMYIWKSGPKAQRRQPEAMRAMVETVELQRSDINVPVVGAGIVEAGVQAEIKSQVEGDITSVAENFIEGMVFAEGEELFRLDDRDYRLALRQARSELQKAESALAIESGRQATAKREWQRLGGSGNTDLALRKPQMASAEAEVEAATARVERAQLDLERTVIRAPFRSVLLSKSVNRGTHVQPGQTVATLVGIDEYHVKVSLSPSDLEWLDLDQRATDAIAVRVWSLDNDQSGDEKQFRTAALISVMGDLEARGRMARLVVAVEDPLAMLPENKGKPKILINAFVRAELIGKKLENVFVLPRKALRDDNKIWLCNDEKKLAISDVKILWSNDEVVAVAEGLQVGEKLITSELNLAVDGMGLVLAGELKDEEAKKNR